MRQIRQMIDGQDGYMQGTPKVVMFKLCFVMIIFGIIWFKNNASTFTIRTSINTYTYLFVSKMSMGKHIISEFD